MLFFDGRLHFHTPIAPDPERCKTQDHEFVKYSEKAFACAHCGRAKANSGAPSVLLSYGESNSQAISESGIQGKHVPVNSVPVFIIGIGRSWRVVVKMAMIKLNRPASLEEIYKVARIIAPHKLNANPHWQEKIRQKLQKHCTRVSKGVYSIN